MYYSIDMRLKSWMPGFVKNVLKNQALTQVPALDNLDTQSVPPASWFRTFPIDIQNRVLMESLMRVQATAWVRKESEKIGVPKHLLKGPGSKPSPADVQRALQDKMAQVKGGWCQRMQQVRQRFETESAKIPQVRAQDVWPSESAGDGGWVIEKSCSGIRLSIWHL